MSTSYGAQDPTYTEQVNATTNESTKPNLTFKELAHKLKQKD